MNDDDMDRRCWSCWRRNRWWHRYHTCGECGHAWTRLGLTIRIARNFHRLRRPSRIYACPCCAHDF